MTITEKDFERLESEVSAIKKDVIVLQTEGAVEKERHATVLNRLDKIDGHISWILRLIVGAIVLAVIGYALKGGFNVGA